MFYDTRYSVLRQCLLAQGHGDRGRQGKGTVLCLLNLFGGDKEPSPVSYPVSYYFGKETENRPLLCVGKAIRSIPG